MRGCKVRESSDEGVFGTSASLSKTDQFDPTGVVDERATAGKTVSVVDMGSALNAATDLSDALHPNDQGFEKMAAVWLEGLNAANELGWL